VQFGQFRALMLMLFVVIALGVSGIAESAYAITINFDTLMKGEIVNTQFQGSNGVIISGINADTDDDGPDLVIIFDSNMFSGNDADLTGPGCVDDECDGDWDGGNLDGLVQEDLEKMIILPEYDTDDDLDGKVDDPNDEAGRPAGTITIEWDDCVESLGLDMIDQEPPDEVTTGSLKFYLNNVLLSTVQFEWFDDPLNDFFVSDLAYGNNFANRIPPITAADLSMLENTSITGFDKVVIMVGGSGAFDNLNYEHCVVGGTGMHIDKTALLVAGERTLSIWLLPVIISVIGIGFFFVRKN
jgi:hypothetical protein